MMLEGLWNDVRHAFRSYAKSPVLAIAIVLTLALGIGVNTAIFSLLEAVVLRPLPVQEPDRLATLGVANSADLGNPVLGFSYPFFDDLRRDNEVFTHLMAYWVSPVTMNVEGGAERLTGVYVSGEYFSGLGIQPAAGRLLTPDDEARRANAGVAVLSHPFWQQRFAGDPGVIGQSIRVAGTVVTVVGVAPAGFSGVQIGVSPDIWMPLWTLTGRMAQFLPNRSAMFLSVIARVRSGVTTAQAEESVSALWRTLPPAAFGPAVALQRERLLLLPGTGALSTLQRQFSRPLWVLMALAGLVLLIVAGNIAGLLTVRALARRTEMSMRVALGGSVARIIRLYLVESAIVCAIGAISGVLIAYVFVDRLLAFVPASRFVLEIRPSSTVLAFSLALSAVTALLLAALPAVQGARLDLRSVIGGDSLTVAQGSHRFDVRRLLVVSQIVFSVVLLVIAGLFLRSFTALYRTDTGIRSERVLQATLDAGAVGYRPAEAVQFYDRLLEVLSARPGVVQAAYMGLPLLGNLQVRDRIVPPGFVADGRDDTSYLNIVSPGIFATLGIELIAGREFSDRDTTDTTRVAIINDVLARRFFGRDEAVGRRLGDGGKGEYEIVGVVASTKSASVREEFPPMVFLPSQQVVRPAGERTLYVRTAGDPTAIAESVREAVRQVERSVPVYNLKTFTQQVEETMVQERMTATLSMAFGGLSLLLASLGLYGILHSNVIRRRREFGVRLALGATPATIGRSVLVDTIALLALGVGLGIAAAVPLARLTMPLLFDVTPTDAAVIATVALVMVAVGVLASAWPAWHASRTEALQAIRTS